MFNQIKIRYSAPSPMTGVITYTTDGEEVQDIFFLEPAETGEFSLLIQGTLTGKTAENVRICSLTAPRGMPQDAQIHEISTDMADLPEEAWIEKNGVRLGIIGEELRPRFRQAEQTRTRPPWGPALGGEIYIHEGGCASDWTAGCIALESADMDRLFPLWPQVEEVLIQA